MSVKVVSSILTGCFPFNRYIITILLTYAMFT
jgi:hypothetical protein